MTEHESLDDRRSNAHTHSGTGQSGDVDHAAMGAGRGGRLPVDGPDPAVRARLALQLQRQIGNRQTGKALGLDHGQPLDSGTRSAAEDAYGSDFADVMIHTDSRAGSLAASHQARAVTFGRSIAFGAGEYRPGSLDGDVVLAHELAHAAQQSPDRTAAGDPSADSLEADADRSAALGVAALRGEAKSPGVAAPTLRSTLQFRRCGSRPAAPPAATLAVTGATQFRPGEYVTSTGSAVTVEITGVSAPAGAPVPPGTVTWTGGTAGADQLHRVVPTTAAAANIITASGGGRTGTVTIHVVVSTPLPASNTPATLRHIQHATPSVVPGNPILGLTVVTIGQQGITGPEFDVTAHLDGNRWRFRVTEIRHTYKIGTNGTGLIPISGVGDPAITPATVGTIMAAFTPRGPSTPPPPSPYWSPTIVRAHEEAHVSNFYNTFWPPRMRTLESEIEGATVPFDPATAGSAAQAVASQRVAWQARADALHQQADAAEIPGSETFAHGVSNVQFTAMVAAIRDSVVPPAPTGLTAVAGSGSATLTWTPLHVANTNGFVLQRRRGAGPFVDVATLGAGVRTHTDSGVPPGPVTYQVVAVGAAGRSAASPPQTVTIAR